MTAVFSGQHGTPDAVFVDACKTMEDVAPAVLWFDEIETGMIAAADSGGAQARLFAFFLTWMQEKTAASSSPPLPTGSIFLLQLLARDDLTSSSSWIYPLMTSDWRSSRSIGDAGGRFLSSSTFTS